MFPMTVTINNAKQLNAVLAALQPDLEASDFKDPVVGAAYVEARDKVTANEATAKKETPKAGKPSPAPAADSSRTAEAEKPVAAAPSPKAESSAPAAEKAPTYDEVKKLILEVSKTKGRDAAIALLKGFGAASGPELKPEQFPAFVVKAKATLS